MSNNTVDLNKYKKSQEDIEAMALEIPDEVLSAYLNEVEINTPDLWSRIETGYEKELKLIDSENKARKKKLIGFIAAAVLIVVIAVPVAIFNVAGKKKDKSDNKEGRSKTNELDLDRKEADSGDYSYMEATEACEENAAYDTQEINYSDEEFDSSYSYNAESTGNQKSDDASVSGSEIYDEDIANEIVFNDTTYVDAKKDMIDSIPDKYNVEEKIPNEYCNFDDKELTILWTGDVDDSDLIYVRYKDSYRLYSKAGIIID